MTLLLLALVSGALAFAQTPAPSPTGAQQNQAPPAASTSKTGDAYDVPDRWSLGVFYWMTDGRPTMIGGQQAVSVPAQSLSLPDARRNAKGVDITAPAGRYNTLEISGFEAKGFGSLTTPISLSLFGTAFANGDFLATDFRLRNVKVSWNYLTWPAPPGNSRFRLKTLWQVQYVDMRMEAIAPLDASLPGATGSKTIILPTLGLGVDLVASKHFRIEAKASGFALPHRSAIVDGEGTAVGRFGHVEVFAGGKYFYFKTSPKADEYFKGALKGPFAGIRWVF